MSTERQREYWRKWKAKRYKIKAPTEKEYKAWAKANKKSYYKHRKKRLLTISKYNKTKRNKKKNIIRYSDYNKDRKAIRNGTIFTCSLCGTNRNIERHHLEYKKGYKVYLCTICHRRLHRKRS